MASISSYATLGRLNEINRGREPTFHDDAPELLLPTRAGAGMNPVEPPGETDLPSNTVSKEWIGEADFRAAYNLMTGCPIAASSGCFWKGDGLGGAKTRVLSGENVRS